MARLAAEPGDPVEQLAWQLGQRLHEHGRLVASAESCTGGAIAQALTERGGSSAWFECGFVTYSNAAKIELLKVSAQILASEGAVSQACAGQMAQGALRASRADYALSVTGIAGPTGAVPGKPVGTVCFGWATRDGALVVETQHFDGDRAAVRAAAAAYALRRAIELWFDSTDARVDRPNG